MGRGTTDGASRRLRHQDAARGATRREARQTGGPTQGLRHAHAVQRRCYTHAQRARRVQRDHQAGLSTVWLESLRRSEGRCHWLGFAQGE